MNALVKMERPRTCMACGHTYVAPVEFSAFTPNLTGELTPPCPRCGSKSISSGWNVAFVHMDRECRYVQVALRRLFGMSATVEFKLEDMYGSGGGVWNLTLTFLDEKLTLEVGQVIEKHTVRTISKDEEQERWTWQVQGEITCPGSYMEPDCSDLVEVGRHVCLSTALVDVVADYFRNRMYDSISAGACADFMEDVPQ